MTSKSVVPELSVVSNHTSVPDALTVAFQRLHQFGLGQTPALALQMLAGNTKNIASLHSGGRRVVDSNHDATVPKLMAKRSKGKGPVVTLGRARGQDAD